MPSAETTERNRWLALYVLCTGVLMIVLDVTVVNVALPAIQDELGFSASGLSWVVNAYLIAFGGLLLLAGRLGDLLGRRRVLLVGLAVFTLASLLCSAAQSQELLVVARLIQGIGGALTSAVILGMIVTMFPEPREQAKAIGVFAFVASAGGSVGLLAGGVLTDAINWHWIFLINLPIGIGTAFFVVRLVEDDCGLGLARGADAIGAALVTSALMLGVYTIVKPAAEQGWGDTTTLLLGGLSLLLLVFFVLRQATAANPLMPLAIFRSRNISGANVVQGLLVAGMFGTFFLGSLYLEQVLRYDELEIGLAFLPATLGMGLMSFRYAEPLSTRFGARTMLFPGGLMILAALLLFARVPVDANYWMDLLPVNLLLGIGAGTCFPALMTIAMSGAEPQDAGLASGLVNTSAQVGGAISLAVLATLAATRTEGLVADGVGQASALTSGYHLSFLVAGALVLVALVVAWWVIEPPRAAEDARAQEETAPGAQPEPALVEVG